MSRALYGQMKSIRKHCRLLDTNSVTRNRPSFSDLVPHSLSRDFAPMLNKVLRLDERSAFGEAPQPARQTKKTDDRRQR